MSSLGQVFLVVVVNAWLYYAFFAIFGFLFCPHGSIKTSSFAHILF